MYHIFFSIEYICGVGIYIYPLKIILFVSPPYAAALNATEVSCIVLNPNVSSNVIDRHSCIQSNWFIRPIRPGSSWQKLTNKTEPYRFAVWCLFQTICMFNKCSVAIGNFGWPGEFQRINHWIWDNLSNLWNGMNLFFQLEERAFLSQRLFYQVSAFLQLPNF